MEESKDLLIIKVNANISQGGMKRIRESITRQKEEGLIILPYFCEALVVPKGIETEVEGGKTDGRNL